VHGRAGVDGDDPATEVAAYYDDYWGRGVYPEGSQLNAPLRSLIEPHAGAATRVLDVGCGNGRAAGRWLNPRVGEYVGVDVSPLAVEAARELGLDARVIEDATALPFADASFDLVVCIEVLEHLLRPDHAVQEIRRVLAPGGVFVATVPNIVFWRRRLDALLGRWHPLGDEHSIEQPWRDPHVRFFTPPTFGAMIARCGFEDVRVGGHDGAFLRAIPGLRALGRGGASELYRRLERRNPTLLATWVNCVAVKPPAADG
jgi:SAM-dependent methyltransferase